jgi:hypothetical protein
MVTVTAPYLSIAASGGGNLPAGMHRTFTVYLSNPATSPMTIALASSDATKATVPASVGITSGSSATFTVTALSPGPVTFTASTQGWTTGTLVYTIGTPTFAFSNLQTSRTVNGAVNTITISALTPGWCACDVVNSDTTVTVGIVGTPSNIVTASPTTVIIPANTSTSAAVTISSPAATGTYNVTASSPGYTQGVSSSVTVT